MRLPSIRREPGNRRSRYVFGIVAVLLLASAPVASALSSGLAPQPAANPEDSLLEVSLDGITWSAGLPVALFASLGSIVPNDEESRVIHLRNASADAAVLRLSATSASASSREFGRALSVGATSVSGPIVPATTLAAIGPCEQLLADQYLQPGEEIPVVVTLRFDDLPALTANDATASFGLRAGLRDPASVALAPTDCSTGIVLPALGVAERPAGDLPSSASPEPNAWSPIASLVDASAHTGWSGAPFAAVALTLTGIGMVLGLARRRRRGNR